MGMLKLGRLYTARLQTQRLGEGNYSSVIQQFLLAQCFSCSLATNQITCYINGPIELAMSYLGVILKADLISLWVNIAYTLSGENSQTTQR